MAKLMNIKDDKNTQEKTETRILLTDPPYGATSLKWDRFEDTLTYLRDNQDGFDAMIIFCNHKLLQNLCNIINKPFHDVVIWDKRPRRSWISWSKPLRHMEFITFWGESRYFDFRKEKIPHPPYQRTFSKLKGGKKRRNKVSYPMYEQIWEIRDVPAHQKVHPTQKPLDLMLRLVKIVSHNSNLTIIDPFEGSGTTRRACNYLGINYIGHDSGEWKNEQ